MVQPVTTFFGNAARVSGNRVDAGGPDVGGGYNGGGKVAGSGGLSKVKAIAQNAMLRPEEKKAGGANQAQPPEAGAGANPPAGEAGGPTLPGAPASGDSFFAPRKFTFDFAGGHDALVSSGVFARVAADDEESNQPFGAEARSFGRLATNDGVGVGGLEDFLGLAPGSLENLTPEQAFDGSALKVMFPLVPQLGAVQSVRFSWNFHTAEEEFNVDEYDDFAFYASGGGQIVFLSSASIVRGDGSSGWQTVDLALAEGVEFIAFGVLNAGDGAVPSYLGVDEVMLVGTVPTAKIGHAFFGDTPLE